MNRNEHEWLYFILGEGRFVSGESTLFKRSAGAIDACEKEYSDDEFPLKCHRIALCHEPSGFEKVSCGGYRTTHFFANGERVTCVSVRAAFQSYDCTIEIEGLESGSPLSLFQASPVGNREIALDLIGGIDKISVPKESPRNFIKHHFVSRSQTMASICLSGVGKMLPSTIGDIVEMSDRTESWPMSIFRETLSSDSSKLSIDYPSTSILRSVITSGFVATASLIHTAQQLYIPCVLDVKSVSESRCGEIDFYIPECYAESVGEGIKASNTFTVVLPRRNVQSFGTVCRSCEVRFCEVQFEEETGGRK